MSWIFAAFLCSIYVDSGLHKFLSPMWHSGFGATTPMGLPSLVWMETSWLTWFPISFLRLFGWGIVAFELSFPLLYLWKPIRNLALLAGIALHVSIGVVYPIPVFAALMLALYAGLLPDHWYEPLRSIDAKIARAKPALQGGPQIASASLNPRRIAASIIVWGLCIVGTYAQTYIRYPSLQLPVRAVHKMIYMTTGIVSHEVFSDFQFERYRYQLRLTEDVPTGASLPYSRGALFGRSIRDRLWEDWWKRTQAPWIPIHDSEVRLEVWADSYWPALSGARTIRIEGRPQQVQMHGIDPALFEKNMASPWRPIGTIRLHPGGAVEISWDQSPTAGDQDLGGYMARILAQAGY